MNLSSILVHSVPSHIDCVNASLVNIPGVEVHYRCQDTGRLVVIQELPDSASEMDGLNHIKSLPHVLAAELVYHYLEDEPEDGGNTEFTSRGVLQ